MPSFASAAKPTAEAKKTITDWLAEQGLGRRSVNYKLRDWLFSRQRYWGEPFPIVLDESDQVRPVAESELPVLLPGLDDFKPTGKPEPPLSKAKDWVRYSERLPPRDQHHAPVGRVVLVLPPLPRSAERREGLGSGEGEVLDAR